MIFSFGNSTQAHFPSLFAVIVGSDKGASAKQPPAIPVISAILAGNPGNFAIFQYNVVPQDGQKCLSCCVSGVLIA